MDGGDGFPIEAPAEKYSNGISHSSSVIHPNAASAYTWNHKVQEGAGQTSAGQNYGSQMAHDETLLSIDERTSSRDTKVNPKQSSAILP